MILLVGRWSRDSASWVFRNNLAFGGVRLLFSALFPSTRWVQSHQTWVLPDISLTYTFPHIHHLSPHSSNLASLAHKPLTSRLCFSFYSQMDSWYRHRKRCEQYRQSVLGRRLLSERPRHLLSCWSASEIVSLLILYAMEYSNLASHSTLPLGFTTTNGCHCSILYDLNFRMLNSLSWQL